MTRSSTLDPRPSTLDPRPSTLDPHPHVAAFSIGFIRSSSQNKKTELVTGGLTYGSSPLHQNVASNYDRRDARLIIAGSLGRASAEDEDHARPALRIADEPPDVQPIFPHCPSRNRLADHGRRRRWFARHYSRMRRDVDRRRPDAH